jgi:hypothetical protein
MMLQHELAPDLSDARALVFMREVVEDLPLENL